ncbi:response regulator transcription factor [Streptomyces sp. NPDC089919]|uniref:response regulator transcription factor n=1 Tax=Streptomyces sp. NPDC089919 TaxID=3155188 RepID=UPI0034152E73
MAWTRVTVIEDDAEIREFLSASLRKLKYDVHAVARGTDGLSHATTAAPGGVIVLDLGLPDIDGMDVLKMLRATVNTPVLVASARDDESHIVRALDLGADDYVIKPFSAEHLDARIRAVLRRTGERRQESAYHVGGLTVDMEAHTATLDGRELEMRPKEFKLLAYLARNAGRVVSKDELLNEIWCDAFGASEKTIDVHLSWLRRRLGETAAEPRYLHSVRGVGVKIIEPAA